MAKNPMPIDEIEDYFFGRPPLAACRHFEARLTQDAALQRHVRELEEGMLALAMAAPQLRPPPAAWTKIQAGIASESQAGFLWPLWPLHWLLKGWPLAAGLVAALFIYLGAVHTSAPGQRPATARTAGKQADNTSMAALPKGTQFPGPENFNAVKSAATAKAAPAGPLASVPSGMFAPAKDQAWHKMGVTNERDTNESNVGAQSLRWRQAVALAMTNERGLTNSLDAQVQVDYREFTNPMASLDSTTLEPGNGPSSAAVNPIIQPLGLSGPVSVFAEGNDLLVFIDAAALPANIGPLTLSVEDVYGNHTLVGTVNPGGNPMVINILNANVSLGYLYTVTASGTNVLGYFP